MTETESYYMRMCASCALHIWREEPSYEYAERARRILYMTGGHESGGWIHRRQQGFDPKSTGGAFGLWQAELSSITDSMAMLRDDEQLFETCEQWLLLWKSFSDPDMFSMLGHIPEIGTRDILEYLQTPEGDPLSCLLARLHYLRVPTPFPADTAGLAYYAKEHYNTSAGKATQQKYLRWA